MFNLLEYRDYFIEVTYSPDDGGYYCFIIGRNGKDIDSTDIYKFKNNAIARAMQIIDNLKEI